MTDVTRHLGPRGWAALVLASGAALATPFVRTPVTSSDKAPAQVGSQPEIDFSNTSWPDVREKSLMPKEVASNLSEQDWAELARLQKNSGSMPRKVTGDLPSTRSAPTLPVWADRGRRVDQLVNESIRSEPLATSAPATAVALEPLRPWMGQGMQPVDRSPLPEPLTGDYAFTPPDPNARWATGNSLNAASDFGSTDSLSGPFTALPMPTEQAVSVPMVSSQIGRAAPPSPKPVTERTKPNSVPTSPKQFIQQPLKRA